MNVRAWASLTGQERRLLELRASGTSDAKVLVALGIGMTEAHALANAVRQKLGLGSGGSLKDAGREMKKAKA